MGINTNEIFIPKKIPTIGIDKELELDTPIPEYCPNIARVIRVDCTPFAEKCSVEEGKVSANGKAVYDILYETDYKNKLKCVSFTQDFSIAANIPRNDMENLTAFCKISCERISCKLLGPRRVLLKATLGTNFDIEGEQAVNAIEVAEGGNVFFRKKTIGFEGKTLSESSIHRFEEEITLNQGEKSIGEIVCGSIDILPPQVNLSSGRAEIRTNATLHTLCEAEDKEGDYYTAQKTVPVSIDYQSKEIEPNKRVSVSLSPQDSSFSPELDQYGESRVIKTAFSVKAQLNINEPKAYTVAEDMFEKDCDIIFAKTSVNTPQLLKHTETNFSAEAKLPPASPKPELILDSSSRAMGLHTEKTEEGLIIGGRFAVTLTTRTSEGVYTIDHTVPFEHSFPIALPRIEASFCAQVYPIETAASLLPDGSVNLRILAGASVSAFAEARECFISEITKRTPSESLKDGSALIYCFPNKDESLWDMAKHYRADPEAIAKENPESFDENGNSLGNDIPVLIKT